MRTVDPRSNSTGARSGLSLQQKSWIITVGVLLTLAALLTLGVDRVFRAGTGRLEREWIADSVKRVESATRAELESLERSARDYATWTDTYEFMANPAQPYAENNLLPATFANLQLDAFLLFDKEGGLRLGRIHRNGQVTAGGAEEWARSLMTHARGTGGSNLRSSTGVVQVPEGIALFALGPILRDDGSGPARGFLAQVRLLDDEGIERLGDGINLDLRLDQSSRPQLTGAEASPQSPSFQTEFINDNLLRIHVPLSDAEGRSIAWWQLTLPREIHRQGLQGRLIFYGVMSVLVIAAAILMGWMLRVMVIARLEALHAAVKHVGATADLSVRLPLHGADELTSVAEGINHMLGALERAEAARGAAEQERERLNKQLQEAQKLEAIGTLTGGLAHDFNNLLSSIQGSATLLRLEAANGSAGEGHLKRIDDATGQAARLVRQMMAFGRRTPTIFAPVHLPDAVKATLELLRPSVPKGIAFRVLHEGNDFVHGDAAQLQQVLLNLATNSSHAMAEGAGQLTIKISVVRLPDDARPETATSASGDYVRLTVSDTGCGIPAESIPRIFEPFYTTKPVGCGTGLGLAVVHGIVTQHHGTVGVESEVGRGTTIFIHLPKFVGRIPAQHAPSSSANGAIAHGGEAGAVLLVDDDVMVRETLEAGLLRRKYQITCAAGGAQALKLIRENRGVFDVVITDQMMPGMTGTELGEIIAHEDPGLPLILVTGFASALSEAKVKAMGFSAMLMKPVTIDELDRAVKLARGH